MSQSRKHRGYATQRIVADYLRTRGWPFATARGAGEGGTDIMHTPGLAIEVKARYGLDLRAWLRHAARNADTDELPVLVIRNNGDGPTTIDMWGFALPLATGVALLNLLQGVRIAAVALDHDPPDVVAEYLRDLLRGVDDARDVR